MKDEKFRKALDAYVEENEIQEIYGETIILDDHSFDNSIIGITDTGILIYDYGKMVVEFAKDEQCGQLEAVEWIDYNTSRAIPYMGSRHPIIIMDSRKAILNKFGEEE